MKFRRKTKTIDYSKVIRDIRYRTCLILILHSELGEKDKQKQVCYQTLYRLYKTNENNQKQTNQSILSFDDTIL